MAFINVVVVLVDERKIKKLDFKIQLAVEIVELF
jgi:ribose 5-phosphate isomerase